MIKVWILTWYWDTYAKDEKYHGTYFRMQESFARMWIDLRRVSYNFFEWKEFLSSIRFTNDDFEYMSESFTPDLIWRKVSEWTRYFSEKFEGRIISSFRLADISWDKFETYLYLNQFQPRSHLLSNFFKNSSAQKEYWDKIVLKPISGFGGEWIELLEKESLLKLEDAYKGISKKYLVQEYLDFSTWYPWLVDWIHDLRVVYFANKYIYATIRQPATWSFKSNIALWGSLRGLRIWDVPQEVLDLCDDIIEQLWVTSRDFISLDFGYCFEHKRWYLFEVNSSPWLYHEEWELETENHTALAQGFIDVYQWF